MGLAVAGRRPSQRCAGTSSEPSRYRESSILHGDMALRRPEPTRSVTDVRSRKSRTANRRWPPRYPGSAEALKMLTLRPVFATPVPRHHIEPRAPDGSRRVLDRATSEQFVVYSPRFVYQFRAGHHAGLWYLRPMTDAGTIPRSVGFPTARAAVAALRAGRWGLSSSPRDRDVAGAPCRVIWS